ncbi:MAG: tetratricopeptide repeat protein [Bryobacterales bacterium]|nr:tetratricopeptide repeat protein [Bryobacterales bacterium]
MHRILGAFATLIAGACALAGQTAQERTGELASGTAGGAAPQECILTAKQLMAEERCLEAEKVLLAALPEAEKAGRNSAFYDAVTNNLACVYLYLGRYREAEHFARQSLVITERLWGNNHSELALDLNNLAVIYYRQGLYSKAEPLFRRALQIATRARGPDDPLTLRIRANLASLLVILSQYSEAEQLHRELLKGLEKKFGAESPEVGRVLNDIAILRFRQGAFSEATSLLEAVVRILDKSSKPPGSRAGVARGNLGQAYYRLGKLGEANAMFASALPILERTIGGDHPEVVRYLLDYAQVLRKLKRKQEAKVLEKRAQAILARQSRENAAQRLTIDVRILRTPAGR